jgi:hypothetical protein
MNFLFNQAFHIIKNILNEFPKVKTLIMSFNSLLFKFLQE